MSKKLNNETIATINQLVAEGYIAEAAAVARALGIDPTETAKPSKTTKTTAKKSAKPTKEPTAKTTAKPSKSTKSKSAKPTKAELDREAAAQLDGEAIFMATNFAIMESEDSRDGSKVWLLGLDESQARLSKPEWLAVTNFLGATADASYYRAHWQFRFDPLHFVQTGKLTAKEAKFVAERKAARKAAKAAKA
jgi:hypothetical protein